MQYKYIFVLLRRRQPAAFILRRLHSKKLAACVHSKQKAGALKTTTNKKRGDSRFIATLFSRRIENELVLHRESPILFSAASLCGLILILIARNDKPGNWLPLRVVLGCGQLLIEKSCEMECDLRTCPLCSNACSLAFKRYTPRWGNPQLGTTLWNQYARSWTSGVYKIYSLAETGVEFNTPYPTYSHKMK